MVKRVKVTRVYEENYASKKPVVLNIGGARSTKSHSLAQLFIQLASIETKPGQHLNLGIMRKTMPALRKTAMRLTVDLLKQYGLYNEDHHNMSENWYELGGNRIQFLSVDEPAKIKSMEFHALWLEEMTEFTLDDFMVMQTRMSGPRVPGWTRPNQILGSMNPDDYNSWIRTQLMERKDVQVVHSTYRDNPFLSPTYVKLLEGLKEQDENYHSIYAMGEWGQAQHIIYTNWDTVNALPDAGDTIWGLDFGFNNPCALHETRIYDGELYHKEHLYESGLTTPTLIGRMKEIVPETRWSELFYADNAEPDRIEEICQAGFNCIPAEKAVHAGIDSVKRYREHITKDSVNFIKEQQSYQWKRDKNGVVLDEPVKFNDHFMDSKRYAVHSYVLQYGGGDPVETI